MPAFPFHQFCLSGAAILVVAGSTLAQEAPSPADASPWGVALGSEWSGEYPKYDPLLSAAGVGWLRYFPEWQGIQPQQDQWNWTYTDDFVAKAREQKLHVAGGFWYLANWVSADGGSRKFPLKDMQAWRDYVSAATARYKADIQYWEVWNEFPSFAKNGSPKAYAELVKEADLAARKVNPDVKIGLGVGNFDIGYLDATIKAGAAGHFDYVCVHPYENIDAAMEGGEMGFLSLTASLRKMLKENKQKADLPLWITEIGLQTSIAPNPAKDLFQADAVTKAYVLSLAQGFEKVFWFEARGPAYGAGTDHGLIRKDWSPRPALAAYQAMVQSLGKAPRYAGWLDLGPGGYGFVFLNGDQPVLAAWAPVGATPKVKFDSDVQVLSSSLKRGTIAAGSELRLDRTTLFIAGLPAALVEQAKANADKPFPWGKDYATATEASIKIGAKDLEDGIKMTRQDTSELVQGLDWTARVSKKAKGGEGNYMYFRVDPTFAPFGTKDLEITLVARRHSPDKGASFSLTYESTTGYKSTKDRFELLAGSEWTEKTWRVSDANFVGAWGWNIRTDASGSPGEFQLREVRIKKVGP